MDIKLAYGRDGLRVNLPDGAKIIQAPFVPGVADEPAAIRAALRQPVAAPPLADGLRPGQTVVVAHSDITRATPNDRLLPVLLAELEAAGIRRARYHPDQRAGHPPQADAGRAAGHAGRLRGGPLPLRAARRL